MKVMSAGLAAAATEVELVRTRLRDQNAVRAMRDALKRGRVHGTADKLDLEAIETAELEDVIAGAQMCIPTSQELLQLIGVSKYVLGVRQWLYAHVDDTMNWTELDVLIQHLQNESNGGNKNAAEEFR
jgi:hypothetical protein